MKPFESPALMTAKTCHERPILELLLIVLIRSMRNFDLIIWTTRIVFLLKMNKIETHKTACKKMCYLQV